MTVRNTLAYCCEADIVKVKRSCGVPRGLHSKGTLLFLPPKYQTRVERLEVTTTLAYNDESKIITVQP